MRVLLTCLALSLFLAAAALPAQQAPIPVKVVVITMFEIGADTGDAPGEFQRWAEGEHLTKRFPLPNAYHDALMNDDGVLGIVTGMGTIRAAATIMALGSDPRFDFSHAYWIVAGIAGGNPNQTSLGSAVWANWVVDGDLAHEIDAREIPPTWTTGYVPLRKSSPYEQPRTDDNGMAFHLDEPLVTWAYSLTKALPLADTDAITKGRMRYAGEAAHQPPHVQRGDTVSSSTFFHGKLLSGWATDWVRYQTEGAGTYVTTGMEDTGTLQSLTWLAKAGRVNLHRVLVLRTVSNYDQQRTGITAAESLAETKIRTYSAFLPAVDAAYLVGDTVVRELVRNWPQYRDNLPGTANPNR